MSPKKKWTNPKINSIFRPTVCANFSQILIKLASVYRFYSQNQYLRLECLKSKHNLFTQFCKDINEQSGRQVCSSFQLGDKEFFIFSIKKFELYGNQSVLTEIVKLIHRKMHVFYKNWYYVESKCKINQNSKDVAHSTLFVSATIAIMFLLGTCIVRKRCVLENFEFKAKVAISWLKPLWMSSMHYHVSSGPFCSWTTINFVFSLCGQGNHVFEETQNSIQGVIGNVYCPDRRWSRQNCLFVHKWKPSDEKLYEGL